MMFYLFGTIVCFGGIAYFCNIKPKEDLMLSDVFCYLLFSLFSWFGIFILLVVFLMFSLHDPEFEKPIIRFKKREKF